MEQFLEIPYKLWQGKGCSGMFFYKKDLGRCFSISAGCGA